MASVRVHYHGNCFDGVTSAAIFSRFFVDQIDPAATVTHVPLTHRQGDPYGADHDIFFGEADVNAVLDFRYSPSARLHWFCDHHQSSFLAPAHREHLEATLVDGQKRFDATAPSCAGLLCRWLAAEHGFDAAPFADHVSWADLIDSASFVDPQQAVELAEPAIRLMALLESVPPKPVVASIIAGLQHGSIEETAARPEISAALEPVLAGHRTMIDAIGEKLEVAQRVGFFDLTDREVVGFNKFIPYHLVAELDYVVGLSRSPGRAKVSVGSNPWHRPSPLTNLAELCGRYGGGGHAVVAAVSFPPAEMQRARTAADEITAVLRSGPTLG